MTFGSASVSTRRASGISMDPSRPGGLARLSGPLLRGFRFDPNLVLAGECGQHFDGNVQRFLKLDQTGLPLLQRALIVALLGEPRLRLRASIAERRIDVAPQ